MNAKSVAVVGATGAVGQEMLRVLEQRRFPVSRLRLLASPRSAGRPIRFGGTDLKVEALTAGSFAGIEVGLFSAGGAVSKEYAPIAAKAGAVVVDNTSAFRMDPQVPLVIPEVNARRIREHHGIIANPNCSTIQMVVVLNPIHLEARVKRVVVTTFQSVSGAGMRAEQELHDETIAVLQKREFRRAIFPCQIAFNAIPQIPQKAAFLPSGCTIEEMKMVQETMKIMEDDSIRVSATCVRVPVFRSHSESVNVETERNLTVERAREILRKAPGVEVVDDPAKEKYPTAVLAAGKDASYVGRLRQDTTIPNGLDMWIVSDNIRKGAALNAVQIAELL
ncbi:MAG: aspartate-semialdehyde dehydrogenase [Planctomycetota bacterium]|nr:aspartate-semialdehyde dehydrogenase [Planctomycetota bacterium]